MKLSASEKLVIYRKSLKAYMRERNHERVRIQTSLIRKLEAEEREEIAAKEAGRNRQRSKPRKRSRAA